MQNCNSTDLALGHMGPPLVATSARASLEGTHLLYNCQDLPCWQSVRSPAGRLPQGPAIQCNSTLRLTDTQPYACEVLPCLPPLDACPTAQSNIAMPPCTHLVLSHVFARVFLAGKQRPLKLATCLGARPKPLVAREVESAALGVLGFNADLCWNMHVGVHMCAYIPALQCASIL
eukprot:311333-Pelagomonas_calceolata.AAC.1